MNSENSSALLKKPISSSSPPTLSNVDLPARTTVEKLSESQEEVLSYFERYGSMTDKALVWHMHSGRAGRRRSSQTDSGIRTRRKELVDKGFLMAVGKTPRTRSMALLGRPRTIWARTEKER